MPFSTEDYIHLPNPDHPESDFRLNNKSQLNIVGTANFGAGVKARLGLLKGTGKSAVVVYLFSTSKFTMETAKEWLENHKEKSIMKNDILKKKFSFTMPLIKGYDGDDGFYHIQFAISTVQPDLQDDQMTENALKSMLNQIKGLNVDGTQLKGINIDDSHKEGLKSIIGPVTDGWITESKQLWVDLRVREEWEKTIRDLENSGSYLGGSIYGKGTAFLEDDGTGINKIDDVFLMRAALTDTPAAWDTRRVSNDVSKTCPMCTQIMKSLGIEELEVKNVTRNENDSYEALRDRVRAAVNAKFTIGDKTKYWVRQTWPDAVIVEDWDADKLYEISYSINEDGDVELGDPIEVETEYVEKRMAFYDLMLKDVQEKPIGGDNLTKTENTIPEGMDETFVEKIKALGDEGKKYLKGLLGVEEPSEGDPTGDPGGNPNPAAGGTKMKILSQEDVKKMLDNQREEIRKEFKTELEKKDEEITSLKKTVDNREETISNQEHDDLVEKAISKAQKLGNEDVKTEEDLLKHLQEKEDFTEEDLKEDPNTCIKTAMRAWKVASRYIPAGKLPSTEDNQMQKIADKHAEKAANIRKSLKERGTQ